MTINERQLTDVKYQICTQTDNLLKQKTPPNDEVLNLQIQFLSDILRNGIFVNHHRHRFVFNVWF